MTSRAAAAQTLLDRRRIRANLSEWVRHAGFEPALHHRLILQKLQDAAMGIGKRKLMFFLPPGAAKSTYVSKLFPPWFLCVRPESAIIAASHSANLAAMFGRHCRNFIASNDNVLGYTLARDSKASDEWETNNGSAFYGVGVGGHPAGRRADLLLIDDPLGSKEDAYSATVRQSQWDWLEFDIRPRCKPNAVEVLIQTRWHVDDLAGRLLKAEGDQWEVVKLPMEARENDPLGRAVGDRLWPEYFTKEMCETAKKNPKVWSSLYQQEPTPETGDFFKAEWLREYRMGDLPANLRIYAASDHAISLKQDADRTCMGCIGVDDKDNIYVLPDIFWKRASADEQVRAMIDMGKRRKPLVWWAEKGHISKSLGPFLRERMEAEQIYFYINEVTPVRDKQTRAQSIAGRSAMGKVFFPADAHWWPEARTELLSFPAGTHDDFVDWIAHIGMGLDRITPAERVAEEDVVHRPMTLQDITFKAAKDVAERKKRNRQNDF
jgi:predicted phage terminase large subunit-like protein